jgi:hypothetical protein
MRRLVIPITAVAAVLAVPAGASGSVAARDQYRLGWVEHARKDGKIIMTFRVRQVSLQIRSWSAQVEFQNRTGRTLRIRPEFALIVSRTRRYDPDSYEPLLAQQTRPRIPTIVFPGQRWKGKLSGPERPRNNRFVRVNFGFFGVKGLFADSPTGFSWITDHVFKVAQIA